MVVLCGMLPYMWPCALKAIEQGPYRPGHSGGIQGDHVIPPPQIVDMTITNMWSRQARLVNNFLDRTEFGLGNSKGTNRPGHPWGGIYNQSLFKRLIL
jgi:hypothetical protein